MVKPNELTPLELEIMNIIWDFEKSVTVREIIDNNYPNGEKAYTTVQTVMNKLETKGFLTKEKIGMVNFYSTKIKRKKIVESETNNFLKNIFKGSPLSLVNYLLGEDKLSADEIEKLKELIEKKEK